MQIDSLASDIESLGKEEEMKQTIFTNISNNLADMQKVQDYVKMKDYMKIVRRAIIVIEDVISRQRARFSNNPKITTELDKQTHTLGELRILSRSYESAESKDNLHQTLTDIRNAINSFINSSTNISNSKNFSLAA